MSHDYKVTSGSFENIAIQGAIVLANSSGVPATVADTGVHPITATGIWDQPQTLLFSASKTGHLVSSVVSINTNFANIVGNISQRQCLCRKWT